MSKAICLKLGGKPLELNSGGRLERSIINFLDKAPGDDLFNFDLLAQALGVSRKSLTGGDIRFNERLVNYTALVNGKRYFGNPKAIGELLRQVAE